MSRFVQGADRRQQTLLPECLDDYVAEDNPVRVVDVFIDDPDLKGLGFEGMTPAATGSPFPPAPARPNQVNTALDRPGAPSYP